MEGEGGVVGERRDRKLIVLISLDDHLCARGAARRRRRGGDEEERRRQESLNGPTASLIGRT